MDIKTYLKEKKELIDSFLQSYLESPIASAILSSAMAYSIFAGGKRIRPILTLASYEACGGNAEDIIPYASALELIHTYSLIHDDLPAMDNDNLRRGKPTSHKVFGEGLAILAGDALLTEAFYLLSSIKTQKPKSNLRNVTSFSGNAHHSSHITRHAILRVIREVAMASGLHGMVGGQAEDISSEDKVMDIDTLLFIHSHKTGALITASVRTGAILAGAGKKRLSALTQYGENIGLAFQIIDDILDVKGDSATLGKTTGSDERKKKMTYPGLYGIDFSIKKAETLINGALKALGHFSEEADPLRGIATYIFQRKN